MKHIATAGKKSLFSPLIHSSSVQAATIVLQPGQASSDEIENEHAKSEQWLFVISGSGKAKIARHSIKLKIGSLLLIEKGERHQIINTGKKFLSTINFYSPPAYTVDENVKRSAKLKTRSVH